MTEDLLLLLATLCVVVVLVWMVIKPRARPPLSDQ